MAVHDAKEGGGIIRDKLHAMRDTDNFVFHMVPLVLRLLEADDQAGK